MSRILNRQRQLAEQGRLRLGYTIPTDRGQRPKSSKTWIVTSHSRLHVEKAAELWGGETTEWQPQGNGTQQWRVITETTCIDAILPPGDPLSQAYEMWNRGGCVRRCDGVTEQLTGSPCPCLAEFGENWYEQSAGTVCDSKSRLKVLLPDMPGLGSWRVETGSYYATDEIAGMVDTIRGAVGEAVLVPVRLRIEPRTRVTGGQTKQFVVPVLELRGMTAGALLGGEYDRLRAAVAAIPKHPALTTRPPISDEVIDRIADATTVEQLRDIWRDAKKTGTLTDALETALKQAFNGIATLGEAEPNPQEIWQQILAAAGANRTSLGDLRADFATWSGGIAVEDANGFQLAGYLKTLKEARQ
nr:MAG TPA: hypothetical protein [Caudoviricetes sp.]